MGNPDTERFSLEKSQNENNRKGKTNQRKMFERANQKLR